jgi:hypothetical protein
MIGVFDGPWPFEAKGRYGSVNPTFLASREAAFMTGANIAINGGQHMY